MIPIFFLVSIVVTNIEKLFTKRLEVLLEGCKRSLLLLLSLRRSFPSKPPDLFESSAFVEVDFCKTTVGGTPVTDDSEELDFVCLREKNCENDDGDEGEIYTY